MKDFTIPAAAILLLLALNPFDMQAQELDKAKVRCLYHYSFSGNSQKPEKKASDEMLLLIGDTYTQFYSVVNYAVDSTRMAAPTKSLPRAVDNGSRMAVVQGAAPLTKKLYSSETGLINRKTNDYQCFDQIGQDFYTYAESLEKPVWKITKEVSDIMGYKCYKATTRYGGRDWIAWFTPDISLSEGPWKLRGLPGLILKAETADAQFLYVAIGLERISSKHIEAMDSKRNYRKVAKNDFFREKKRFFKNPLEGLGVTIQSSPFKNNEIGIDFNLIEKLE